MGARIAITVGCMALLAGCGSTHTRTTSEADVQIAAAQQKILIKVCGRADSLHGTQSAFVEGLSAVEELITAARHEPTAAHRQQLVAEQIRLEGPDCEETALAYRLRQALAEPPLAR